MPHKFKVTLLQANTKNYFWESTNQKNIDIEIKIFYNINYGGSYVIYLMECILCNEQYVGKAETSFNITLYNHQEDVKNVDAVMGCKPFH